MTCIQRNTEYIFGKDSDFCNPQKGIKQDPDGSHFPTKLPFTSSASLSPVPQLHRFSIMKLNIFFLAVIVALALFAESLALKPKCYMKVVSCCFKNAPCGYVVCSPY